MAHAADFHGDQLRLSAFLRVVGKVPERPKRLQRSRQALLSPPPLQGESASAIQPANTGLAPSGELAQDGSAKVSNETMPELDLGVWPIEHNLGSLADHNPSRAGSSSVQGDSTSAVHSPTADVVLPAIIPQDGGPKIPDEAMPELHPCVHPAEQDSGSPTDENSSRAGSASNTSDFPDVYEQIRFDTEEEQQSNVPVVSSSIKRKKVVYNARKKQSKPPMGVLYARKKHRLPSENGLVFARASTEDGLPLPGHAEVLLANQIAETDPIQDSQLDNIPNRLRKLAADAGVRPPGNPKPRVDRFPMSATRRAKATRLSNFEPFAYRGPIFQRPHTQTRLSEGVSLTGPGALCDGFVGQEMFVPERKVKTQKHAKKKHMDTPEVEDNVDHTKGGLQLANGFLPVSCPISPTIPKAKSTPLYEHGTQLELVHPSVEDDFGELRQDSVDSPLHRRTTPIAIRTQLSGITAPMREEEGSESSSDPESEADISGWGLEDIFESDMWRPGFILDRDGMKDFGQAMYGMNNKDDNGFWSQYLRLD